jgi:hypothetical protein
VANGRRVVFEIDGKEYHRDRLRDDARDRYLLLNQYADEIVHLPAVTICYEGHATFNALEAWYPWLRIGVENTTLTLEEALEQKALFEEIQDPNYRAEVKDFNERCLAVWWHENESVAWVMSYKLWLDGWRGNPIRRLTREMLLQTNRRN